MNWLSQQRHSDWISHWYKGLVTSNTRHAPSLQTLHSWSQITDELNLPFVAMWYSLCLNVYRFSANICVIKIKHWKLMYCNLFSLITEIDLPLAKHTLFCSYKASRHAAPKKQKKSGGNYTVLFLIGRAMKTCLLESESMCACVRVSTIDLIRMTCLQPATRGRSRYFGFTFRKLTFDPYLYTFYDSDHVVSVLDVSGFLWLQWILECFWVQCVRLESVLRCCVHKAKLLFVQIVQQQQNCIEGVCLKILSRRSVNGWHV